MGTISESVCESGGKCVGAAEVASCPQDHPAFDQFVATIAALRAPDGCPWDREQTHGSIARNMIEEAYEAVDAIEANDVAHLREELGDVLLQVVLQSQIAVDAGEFSIDDVCRDVNEKMVRRHPHVFGEAHAANANEVLDLWDKVKLSEKKAADEASASARAMVDASAAADGLPQGESARAGLLDGVPKSFPALMQAQKVSRKAAAAGFEWNALEDVWSKVREEVAELREAYDAATKTPDGKVVADVPKGASASDMPSLHGGEPDASGLASTPDAAVASGDSAPLSGGAAAVEMEFGDVLFALVNVGRRMGVDAESALRASCAKFRERWSFIEGAAWAQGRAAEDLSTDEMEALWAQAKAELKD